MAFNTEDLFQSIDTIVKQRLSEKGYDTTVICTIVDNSKKNQGIYTVTNNIIEFEAYADQTTYQVNEQVRITIPEGNYNNTKWIEGRVLEQNTVDNNSVNEIILAPQEGGETLAQPVELWANGAVEEYEVSYLKLLQAQGYPTIESANIYREKTSKLYSLLKNNALCNIVKLSAKFKVYAENQEYDIEDGEYGIKLLISYSNNIQKEYILSSKEMEGNPYNFTISSRQTKYFELEPVEEEIKKIELIIFQKGDFKYAQNDNIEKLPENYLSINVTSLELEFGINAASIPKQTAMIMSQDNINYTNAETKTIDLLWNNIQNDVYIGIEDEEIFWYKYDPSLTSNEDPYITGIGWQRMEIEERQETLEFTTNPNNLYEKFQVVVLHNDVPYRSNVLEFKNTNTNANIPEDDEEDIVLDQNSVFNALTNNGATKNIWLLEDKNELFINASVLGSSLLRSSNFNGEVTDTALVANLKDEMGNVIEINGDKISVPIYNIKWGTQAPEGMCWNLITGQLLAANFTLQSGQYGKDNCLFISNKNFSEKDNTRFAIGSHFKINSEGRITSTGGTIGGIFIDNNGLTSIGKINYISEASFKADMIWNETKVEVKNYNSSNEEVWINTPYKIPKEITQVYVSGWGSKTEFFVMASIPGQDGDYDIISHAYSSELSNNYTIVYENPAADWYVIVNKKPTTIAEPIFTTKSSSFSISNNGLIEAINAKITGTIKASSITAGNKSEIVGWEFDEDLLSGSKEIRISGDENNIGTSRIRIFIDKEKGPCLSVSSGYIADGNADTIIELRKLIDLV